MYLSNNKHYYMNNTNYCVYIYIYIYIYTNYCNNITNTARAPRATGVEPGTLPTFSLEEWCLPGFHVKSCCFVLPWPNKAKSEHICSPFSRNL